MMTISKPRVKSCGPHCHCPACNEEWADYREEQRRIDERVMREHLERRGHYEPCDLERTWEGEFDA
jgi:hypothetical protein